MKQSRLYPVSRLRSLEQYRQEIYRCVKCGACRAVCPTFLVEREESRSARGRMALIKAVLDHRIPISKIYLDRLATCTGCLACEAACPSGVRVTEIIQAAKEPAVRECGAGTINAVVAEVVKRPALLHAVAWLAPFVLHYAKGDKRQGAGVRGQGSRNKRGRVLFFPGCAVTHFQQDIGASLVAVLERLGFDVILSEELTCCGRPLLSLGDHEAARELADHNTSVFSRLVVDAVVTACASCGLTFKREYSKLLGAKGKVPVVLDIHEFLSHTLEGTELAPVHKTVTWHEPCHLGRGQGLSRTARDILSAIPGLTFVEMENADRCCGFGGVMRITHRKLSDGIATDKIKSVIATRASMVVTGCPGCRMQIADALRQAGSNIEVVHTVQILEEAM